jgi:DNA topoisomerase-1
MRILLIVESPSKCKKIEKYLNDNSDFDIYEVVATMGHITELKTLKNIDVSNHFKPTYELIEDKKNNIDMLRRKINAADEVILACDNDREGESINYHICESFNLPLATTKRILFNEITESAIQYAIKTPTTINMNIVYAQQSRQILDLLVGFTITPMLWKYITRLSDKGLSAGRCQTPALRLIYDNYMENQKIVPTKTYNIAGYFTNLNLLFQLTKNIESEQETSDFLEESVNFTHVYTCSPPKNVSKKPPTPFTTSSLQQMASNELHYSPKETMKYCQELYENGYITYMRTDSDKYCKEFIQDANKYIIKTYSEKYIQQLTNTTDSSFFSATTPANAHEAIRPTSISTKTIPTDSAVSQKATRVYNLIWRNTLESCMSDANVNTIVAEITAPNNYKYKYNCETIVFPGWKIVAAKKDNEDDKYSYLLTIKQNATIEYKKIVAEVTLKNLPHHYTEAYLVQLLEKQGIGRPSTFATLVDKLQERVYVKKQNIEGKLINCVDYMLENDELSEIQKQREFGSEKNKLVIQPLGIIVIEFLIKHFPSLFDYHYTKTMEDQLDQVASGNLEWPNICKECYAEIQLLSESLLDETKCNIKIDENNSYIIGKNGPVIKQTDKDGNVSFKQVKQNIDMTRLKNGEYKLEDIVEIATTNKIGKYQGEDLIVRKGKYGLYCTWGDNSKTLSCFGNRPVENITFIEVFEILEKDGILDPNKSVGFLREISKTISIRRSKLGDYIYYKTTRMKAPKFFKLDKFTEDYRNCEKSLIKDWIKTTYNIE